MHGLIIVIYWAYITQAFKFQCVDKPILCPAVYPGTGIPMMDPKDAITSIRVGIHIDQPHIDQCWGYIRHLNSIQILVLLVL
jgi:hypothetical protein